VPQAQPSRSTLLAGYAAFVLIGWNAVLIPSLIRSLEHDFRQSDAAFGLLYFLSALVYAAGSFGGGFLTERFGRQWILISAAGFMAVGLVGEGLAPTWAVLLLATIPVNWGAGSIDGGVNGLFLDLFREGRGGALNFLHLFFSVGAFVSPVVVGQLIATGVSWRPIVLAVGAASLLLALYLIPRDMPAGHTQDIAAEMEGIDAAERSLWPFVGLAAGICLYVAAEGGVSSWLVKFLASSPIATATLVLSVYWAGIALGRLLSNWIAEWLDYAAYTVACVILSSVALVAAILTPSLPLSAGLFALTGLFYGPIYPMIMAIGGAIYPHRLARLSGSLAAAAVVGGLAYPPLIGLMSASLGVRAGLLGAGALGLPMAIAIALAAGFRLRGRRALPQSVPEAP
jgi:fucose permease